LGDGVNVAARLEGINKLFGTTICISDSIYDQVQSDLLARPLKRVQVKGRKTEFMIYELLAFRATDDPELRVRDRDEERSAMTWRASQQMEAGDFAAAERAYRAILDCFPGDPVAKFMLKQCEEFSSPTLQPAVRDSACSAPYETPDARPQNRLPGVALRQGDSENNNSWNTNMNRP
jgi:hypothetical protein